MAVSLCMLHLRHFHLHREAVVSKAYRPPKGNCSLIVHEDIKSDALRIPPDVAFEPCKRGTTNALPPTLAGHKELPQVDPIRFRTKECVADSVGGERKDDRPVLTHDPPRNPPLRSRPAQWF